MQPISLAYQPIVSLSDGSIAAIEALTRVRAPFFGSIRPDRFVAWTEAARLSCFHTNWVLRTSCSQVAGWQFPNRPLLLSVNVSPRDVFGRRFALAVSAALCESGLYPSNLQLEITETSMIEGGRRIADRLAELRDLGVRIAIDDFGAGYSNLKALLEVPADTVKLDGALVANVAFSSKCRAVVSSAIAMAHSLGMEAVAEGVETREQRAFLRSAGCDSIQGYLVSPPMAVDRLCAMMAVRVLRQERSLGRAVLPSMALGWAQRAAQNS
jgi:EAL domain-containing protein (putative c-di-GMP-specific phosphodiesterase class I)